MYQPSSSANVIVFSESNTKLPNKAVKEKKMRENKEWKSRTRGMGWIGEDPNIRHSAYYLQQIQGLNEEMAAFRDAMSKPLPVTFRLGHRAKGGIDNLSCVGYAIQNTVNKLFNTRGRYLEANGEVINGGSLRIIPWLGDGDVWSMNIDAASLSKNESLKHIHDYTSQEADLGFIVRQELVSMIPARVLDVKEHHVVVDLCSAPGSKTEQALSIMQSQCGYRTNPKGCIIANDADHKRIERLHLRYQRSGSSNLLLTCSPAEGLVDTLGRAIADRVLCDVPCTGDGTFRKSPHLWRLFRPRMALEIHPLQLQIAIAGGLLLKPGGRMVYSTCSLNPIENEAVVAALLRHYKGSLRLIDPRDSDLLNDLQSRRGMSSWRCDVEVFVQGEESDKERRETLSKLPPILKSMYPPTNDEISEFHLEYCLRIMPHDQDTGGFFVAVLEMTSKCIPSADTTILISEDKAHSAQYKLGYNLKSTKGILSNLLELPVSVQTYLKEYLSRLVGNEGPGLLEVMEAVRCMRFRTALTSETSKSDEIVLLCPRSIEMLNACPSLLEVIVHAGVGIGEFRYSADRSSGTWHPNADNMWSLVSAIPSIKLNSLCSGDFLALLELGTIRTEEEGLSSTFMTVPITIQDAQEKEAMIQANIARTNNKPKSMSIDTHIILNIVFDLEVKSIRVSSLDNAGNEVEFSVSSDLEKVLLDIMETNALNHSYSSTLVIFTIDLQQSARIAISSVQEHDNPSKRRMSKAERKNAKRLKTEKSTGTDSNTAKDLKLEETMNNTNCGVNYANTNMLVVFELEIETITKKQIVARLKKLSKDDSCRSLANTVRTLRG